MFAKPLLKYLTVGVMVRHILNSVVWVKITQAPQHVIFLISCLKRKHVNIQNQIMARVLSWALYAQNITHFVLRVPKLHGEHFFLVCLFD